MTRSFVAISAGLIVLVGVLLLGQQMVQNAPAAAEAAERLMRGAPIAAPVAAQAIAVQFPDAPRFSDRELNAVELLIKGILIQSMPDRILYGTQKGGRVAFVKGVPVPLGGTNRTYPGQYIAVFGVKKWDGQIPKELGFAIEISGPHINIEHILKRYCLAYQIYPFPEYISTYDAPNPGYEGWDRGPCE